MKNLNEHVSKMRKLINSRHGIIKPFLNEQEEEEKVNFEETNDLKEDCEELKETLQDLIDSLEKACASEDIVDTLKRDFTFSKQQIDSFKSSIGDTIRDTTKFY